MNKENIIDELNKLLVVNNYRVEGYKKASDNTDDKDLQTLFPELALTSQKCRFQLISEIEKLGGIADEGTKATGNFFRAWMDVKSALAGNDRKSILNSCKQGEESAIETYENVFNDKSQHLTTAQKSMIRGQYELLKSDHGKISTMHNAQQAVS
ncbi:MAG: PA2169 family four-helix-bundle protein [Balneolaceae bacterium]|nr:PA2169 family four-helix-bundle protein [Balneolaceae bacterium]